MGSPSLRLRERLIGGQAELAHLLLQVLAVHADLLGRLGDVAAVAAERLAEEVALEGLHQALLGLAEGRRQGAGRRTLGDGGAAEEVGGRDLGSGGEQQRLLDGRAQLAHVPPPLVRDAGAQRLAGERLRVAREAPGGLLQEVVDQQRDVLAPLGERRNGELDDAQAVVEVLAEAAGAHGALEVLVGGGDEPHVDPDRHVPAHPLELLLLDGAQELRLRLERHGAHLVPVPLAPRISTVTSVSAILSMVSKSRRMAGLCPTICSKPNARSTCSRRRRWSRRSSTVSITRRTTSLSSSLSKGFGT